jgi:hypothetical protein
MTPDNWIKLAQIFGAVLAACITAGVPLLLYVLKIRRDDMAAIKADGEARKEAITAEFHLAVCDMIRKGMQEAAEEAGPDHTHVIRCSFLTGHYIAAPLTRKWITVDRSGAAVQLLHSDEESTRYQLDCPGPYEIESHNHPEIERVTVVNGSMADMITGRIYGPGETWEIPEGKNHHVLFGTGTMVYIKVVPPLPTIRKVPLNLDDLHLIGSARP